MRKLVARVFDYSLDGLVADEGTEYFKFCRDLPDDPAQLARTADLYERAYAHIMGRAVYEGMAGYFPTAVVTPSTTGLVAARTKLKRAGSGSHPVPYSALVRAPLIRSRGCQISSRGKKISSASKL